MRLPKSSWPKGSPSVKLLNSGAFAATTILGHLERISDQGEILDLTHLLPPSERLDQIELAFRTCGSAFFRPVWEYLGPDFTYDELRLARIHLRQQGRLEEE